MNLSIGRLRQLVTVAKCGSVSKAAADLNITQPALSRSIAALEARYGFAIFNRVGHGVELTAAGAQVVAQAEELLQRMRVFDDNVRLIGSGNSGTLSMGMAPLLASQLLARFAGEFFVPESKAELRVLIRRGDELLAALRNDEIELFFYAESYIEPTAEIEIERIGAIRSICVVRSGHPLLSRPRVTMKDVSAFPWASAVEPVAMPEALGPARFVCDNYHILREAVLRTDLVCICSADFAAEQIADGTLQEIEIEGPRLHNVAIFCAYLRGRMRSPLAAQAVERMRRYLG